MADKQAKLTAALRKRPSDDDDVPPPPLVPTRRPDEIKLRKSNLNGTASWEQCLALLELNLLHEYAACVETVTKMLTNITTNPSEPSTPHRARTPDELAQTPDGQVTEQLTRAGLALGRVPQDSRLEPRLRREGLLHEGRTRALRTGRLQGHGRGGLRLGLGLAWLALTPALTPTLTLTPPLTLALALALTPTLTLARRHERRAAAA